MSDDKEKEAHLLAETYHGDWASGPAAQFARVAAAHARRHRARRRALAASGGAMALMLAGIATWRHPVIGDAAPPSPGNSPVPDVASAPRGYEIISDDELLAQLRDRPVFVMKRADGSRAFVMLNPAPDGQPLE